MLKSWVKLGPAAFAGGGASAGGGVGGAVKAGETGAEEAAGVMALNIWVKLMLEETKDEAGVAWLAAGLDTAGGVEAWLAAEDAESDTPGEENPRSRPGLAAGLAAAGRVGAGFTALGAVAGVAGLSGRPCCRKLWVSSPVSSIAAASAGSEA